MRKTVFPALMLTAALAVTGCAADKTGEVGQKNIRPYTANDYEKNRLRINGVHSFGSPTYRTRFANDEANERNRWMGRNGLGHNLVGAHENYRLEMNDRAAREIASLPEVRSAYVLTTDTNAYVGIALDPASGAATAQTVSPQLKSKITERVRAMSPSIRNVYVTSQPEFTERMQYYARQAASGHPVQEFLAEFNALAARIFPASPR